MEEPKKEIFVFLLFDVAVFTPSIFLKQTPTMYRLLSSANELERIRITSHGK
jgi:hypothetical protein